MIVSLLVMLLVISGLVQAGAAKRRRCRLWRIGLQQGFNIVDDDIGLQEIDAIDITNPLLARSDKPVADAHSLRPGRYFFAPAADMHPVSAAIPEWKR